MTAGFHVVIRYMFQSRLFKRKLQKKAAQSQASRDGSGLPPETAGSDVHGLPSLREIVRVVVKTIYARPKLVIGVNATALIISILINQLRNVPKLPEILALSAGYLWLLFSFNAIAIASEAALYGEQCSVLNAYKTGAKRLLTQCGLALCGVLMMIISLLFAAALTLGVPALRILSENPHPVAQLGQSLIWIAVITIASLAAVPFFLTFCFAALDVTLEAGSPWGALGSAFSLFWFRDTRGYLIRFTMLLGIVQLLKLVIDIPIVRASALLHIGWVALMLTLVVNIVATTVMILACVHVWRCLLALNPNRSRLALPPVARRRPVLVPFLTVSLAYYAFIHPHFGDSWTLTHFSSPNRSTNSILQRSSFRSQDECERARAATSSTIFPLQCEPHYGPQFGW